MRLQQLPILSLVLLMSAVAFSGADTDLSTAPAPKFIGKVRIGVEAPLSGDQKTLGEGMLNGAKLAADQINADGGYKRRKIVIVPIDDAATWR